MHANAATIPYLVRTGLTAHSGDGTEDIDIPHDLLSYQSYCTLHQTTHPG